MIHPPLVEQGNKVALIAPAGRVTEEAVAEAIELFKIWGLEVVMGNNVFGQHRYFSGKDSQRLSDLQWAIDDERVDLIFCARGGYGATRIIDQVDFSGLLKRPRWFIGFSDITAIHLKLNQLGLSSIHGAMGTTLTRNLLASDAMHSVLFDGKSHLVSDDGYRDGTARAEITGGNLALLADSIGTSNEVDTNDKILVIEDIGEPLYRIDRMLNQLKRAGKLDSLAGLVVGHFTDIAGLSPDAAQSWKEVIIESVSEYQYPVSFGFPIGHEPENHPFVMGANYEFSVNGSASILEIIA